MSDLGTPQNPIRVAVVGSGPAGFHAADFLLRDQRTVQVDMYDRLPTPFGLVRAGVAPDHQKIKAVTKLYDRVAARPGFRFYGNVTLGKHIRAPELADFYHAILYSTGAETDRNLNIPGIDLKNSHTATEFVAWYNGHPDYADRTFDLSHENVVVVGIGNVAVDVCRILAHTPERLAETDMAPYAEEALRESRVKNIYMLGRRGPAQAAFTVPEARELGRLDDCSTVTLPEEVELDPLSAQFAEQSDDRTLATKLDIIKSFAHPVDESKARTLTIRFLTSPAEIQADDEGRVARMRLVHNQLVDDGRGGLRASATELEEWLDAGLVFRSVGYYGVPLPDVPFREDWGIIPNEEGRVVDMDTGRQIAGHYVAGWIKRGPSGVIGTNRPDSKETVTHLVADVVEGRHLFPVRPNPEQVDEEIRSRQSQVVTWEDWQKLDALEMARGAEQGRPRVKFTSVEEMLAVVRTAEPV